MFCDNIIQSVNQFWLSERDMRGALLKVSDAEHLIFIALFTLNRLNVIIQTKGDVSPVVGDWFTAEQVQHSFQIGESVSLLSGDKMKSPPVPSHQIVDDNFTAKFTGAIGFVIPVQPSGVEFYSRQLYSITYGSASLLGVLVRLISPKKIKPL